MPLQDNSLDALHDLAIPDASQDFETRIMAAASTTPQTGYARSHTSSRVWFAGAAIAASLAIAALVLPSLTTPATTINGIDILADVDFGEEQIYAGLY